MALAIDGERTSGQDVRTQNTTAVLAVANIVKSSLGPVGLDKMLVCAQLMLLCGLVSCCPHWAGWKAARSPLAASPQLAHLRDLLAAFPLGA